MTATDARPALAEDRSGDALAGLGKLAMDGVQLVDDHGNLVARAHDGSPSSEDGQAPFTPDVPVACTVEGPADIDPSSGVGGGAAAPRGVAAPAHQPGETS